MTLDPIGADLSDLDSKAHVAPDPADLAALSDDGAC